MHLREFDEPSGMHSGGRADESSLRSRSKSAVSGADSSADSIDRSGYGDPSLARIVDEITRRLQDGEDLGVDEYAMSHPEWAAILHSLLEPLRLLAQDRPDGEFGPGVGPSGRRGRPPGYVRRLHRPPRGRPGGDGHRLRGGANLAGPTRRPQDPVGGRGTRPPVVAAVSGRGAGGRLPESRPHRPGLRRRIARRRPVLRDAVYRGGQPGGDHGRPEAGPRRQARPGGPRPRKPGRGPGPRPAGGPFRASLAGPKPGPSGTSGRTTTSARSPGWPPRRPRPWTTPTSRGSSTATSSRPTSSWTAPASSGSPISAWPGSSAATP